MAEAKKVALITGANKGIGFETAKQLGEQGITVVVAARDQKKADETAQKLKAVGIDAYPVVLEVTRSSDFAKVYEFLDTTFGKLDILINNAGVGEGTDLVKNTALTVDQKTLRSIFDTNFFGLIELTQALVPLLQKSPAGRIVNLSSILGSLTLHADPNSPIAGTKIVAYNASKAALNLFTIHLAAALKDTPIKVNSAHPGWVKTDMGTDAAPMEIVDGAKTSVRLATLPADGPTGGYFHMDQTLPW
ncbi:SDR family oxidoreductase [Terriglobus saanensis]|uniref:Short-chain dehydrogenase/reductase SDR n=1 Tax=Terriglobus saanensis (strain ATCC BAA-1853 / DSM 23119 / SP1PR4) TaxID=401053 RepID=E8V2U9_TERSS|nr:SDR family oxidoreductase [Terriglobus saanensis]ADV84646.1 short-chain dehydrogenase/reductase SDR [Terriglobus saanensis SP1PR4]